jgi:hypothetical protein
MQTSNNLYNGYTESQLMDYIMGEASAKDVAEIEHTINNSPAFAQTVTNLRNEFALNLHKATLRNFNISLQKTRLRKKYIKIAMGITGAMAIAASLFIFVLSPASLSPAEFNQLLADSPPDMIKNDKTCQKAIDAYNDNDFTAAIYEFELKFGETKSNVSLIKETEESFIRIKTNDPIILFYYIAAHLAAKEKNLSPDALRAFDKGLEIAATNALVAPNANFLRANIASRLNDTKAVKDFLEKTAANDKSEYQEAAAELLKRL